MEICHFWKLQYYMNHNHFICYNNKPGREQFDHTDGLLRATSD